MKSYYQEIRYWRNSECRVCGSKSICSGSDANITMCLKEGPSSNVDDFRSALIIRTIRVVCSNQRKMRRSMQGVKGVPTGRKSWTHHQIRTRAAHLICSNREEFSRCLR